MDILKIIAKYCPVLVLYLMSLYQRSSMIWVRLRSRVRAQATFWPTPGGVWNLKLFSRIFHFRFCESSLWIIISNFVKFYINIFHTFTC